MSIGSYKSTLITQIKGDIESTLRTYIMGGDVTPYPNLTLISQLLAQTITNRIVDAITSQAAVTVFVPSVGISGSNTLTQTITNGTIT